VTTRDHTVDGAEITPRPRTLPAKHNAKPKPFVWSKTAEDILTRERRAIDALDHIRGNR